MRTAAAGAKKKGMTQQQLARQLGISKSAVGNYETGVSMPREDVLLRLFSALDAEPNYLFQDSFRPGGGVLSSGEQRLVQRYRALSAKGKAAVNTVLDAVEEKARRFGGCVADAQAGAAHSTVCFACGGGLCFSGAGRGIRDDRRRRGRTPPNCGAHLWRFHGAAYPGWIHCLCGTGTAAKWGCRDFLRGWGYFCKQYYKDALGIVYLFSLNRARADADVVLPPSSGRTLACFGRVLLKRRFPLPAGAR